MRLRRMLAERFAEKLAERTGTGIAFVAAATVVLLGGLALPRGAEAVSTFTDAARFDTAASTSFPFNGPPGTVPGNAGNVQWVIEGAAGDEDWLLPLVTEPATFPGLGSRFVGNIRAFPLIHEYSDIGLRFPTAEEGVGVVLGQLGTSFDATALSISVLTGGGELYEFDYDLSAPGSPSFLGFTDPTGIAEVRWRAGNAGYFGIDDLTVGSVIPQIPEPSAALLLGLGLAGLRAAGRRRR